MDKNITDKKDLKKDLLHAAMPLVELLRKKWHPHMTVVVTGRGLRVVEDVMGMPLDYDD